MNVIIVGYGRMGKLIEEVLGERGHRILCRVDSAGIGDTNQVSPAILDKADGIVDFALAKGILERIEAYAQSGKPAVIGATGWNDKAGQAKRFYEQTQSAILRGSNFSVGAHLFFRLTAAAARLVNNADEYDVALTELHHTGKADYPSGTALNAAEGILSALDRKTRIVADLSKGPIPKEDLQIASIRVGSVPGVHEMQIDSQADYLTIRHEARSRRGFALGAVRGLEWLKGKTGWHEAEEFMDDLLATL